MTPGFEAVGEIMAEKTEELLSGGEALSDRLSREGDGVFRLSDDGGGDEGIFRLPDDGGEDEGVFRLSDDGGEDGDSPEPPDGSCKTSDTDKPSNRADNKDPEDQLTPEEKQDNEIEAVENGEKLLDTTQKKGNYGEMKTDQDLRNRGYKKISKEVVTSVDDPGHKGIDGVYYNPDGRPPYIIADAKYNTAQLDKEGTAGPQMSQSWIDANLDDAVGKGRADEIRLAMLEGDVGCYVAHVAKGGDLNAPVTYDQVNENGTIVEKDVKINAA